MPLGRVVHGAGCLARLGEAARGLGGTRALLVTDAGLRQAGHPQRAEALLAEAGLNVAVFDEVDQNPTNVHVHKATAAARAADVDIIIAVGGGSAMDCAKGANFLLTNGGTMADYRGFGKATKPMLPSVGVPTTAGTGSEAQSFALITDEKTHIKMACGDRKAAFRVSLLDPELTLSQPHQVTAVTGIDAVAHAVESYVCTKRNAYSQMAALAAWRMLEANFETVLREPDDLAARAAMQVGANLSGASIESSMLGCCHSCANPLTAHYGLIHGVAVGLMLPHVVRFNAAAAGAMYGELVAESGHANGEPAGSILAARVTEMMTAAGLPTKLSDAGVSRSILPLLAEEASQQWTAQFNPRPVGEAELFQIYEAAW